MRSSNLVPRADVPFGQHQDTELWNNQFQETKILGLPVSRRMCGLVYMASRDKVDVDTFHKGIQYALEKLGKSNFKSKRRETSGNELVDYSRAPCLGADQKARGLWEGNCLPPNRSFTTQILGGHVTSRDQGLCSNDQGRKRRETLGTRLP